MSENQSNDHEQERRLVESLADDPYFRDWTDASRLFGRRDIDDAISQVLGTSQSALPPLPGAQERAMARLALFQIVARHLEEGPISWEDVLSRLSPHEMREVEELLGESTLNEFLD